MTKTKLSPLDHLRSRKKPVHRRVPIYLDSDAVAKADKARAAAAEVKLERKQARTPAALDGAVAEAEADLAQALEELEEATAWFLVQAMAPEDYDDLIDKHPPSKDQKQTARRNGQQLPWNPDTFPPVLIAATTSLIHVPDPEKLDEKGEPVEEYVKLDREFVEEMKTSGQWNAGEIMTLFQAALDANSAWRQRDLGNG